MSEDSLNETPARIAAEAKEVIYVLEYIRKGRLDRALEMLETSLDLSVLALDDWTQQSDSSHRSRLIETLRQIRDYRTHHPRQLETHFREKGAPVAARVQEIRERARSILDSIS